MALSDEPTTAKRPPEAIVLGATTFSKSAIARATQTPETPARFLYEGRQMSRSDTGMHDSESDITFDFEAPWHWHYSWVGRSSHFSSTAKTRHCMMFYLVLERDDGSDILEVLEVARSKSFRIDVPGKMARKLKHSQRRTTMYLVRSNAATYYTALSLVDEI